MHVRNIGPRLDCRVDTRSRAAEDERQWSLYMWHVQYVMTASVWLRWQCTDTNKTVHALYSLPVRVFPRYVRPGTEPCNTVKPSRAYGSYTPPSGASPSAILNPTASQRGGVWREGVSRGRIWRSPAPRGVGYLVRGRVRVRVRARARARARVGLGFDLGIEEWATERALSCSACSGDIGRNSGDAARI